MAEAEDALLARAIARDADALALLLERHGPEVRSSLQIGARWKSALAVDDVMQVTYMEAFIHIDRFVPSGGGAFVAWLRRIAENNLRDAIRELERAKRPPPAWSERPPP